MRHAHTHTHTHTHISTNTHTHKIQTRTTTSTFRMPLSVGKVRGGGFACTQFIYNFRIRTEMNGGAWCPGRQVSKDSLEYLQIDLGQLKVITLVETQGRFGYGQVGQKYPSVCVCMRICNVTCISYMHDDRAARFL